MPERIHNSRPEQPYNILPLNRPVLEILQALQNEVASCRRCPRLREHCARIAAVNFVRKRFTDKKPCFGWEVDDACRKVVVDAGYGEFFVHRTGHSIGEEVHGNGVNIDNLETKDERLLVPGICFSIEPGIYLKGEMAARTEIDCFITLDGKVGVAGEEQMELVRVHG